MLALQDPDVVVDWLVTGAWLGGAAAAGLVAHWLVFVALRAAVRGRPEDDELERRVDEALAAVVTACRAPARWVLPLLLVLGAVAPAGLPDNSAAQVRHATSLLLILSATWLLARALTAGVVVVLARHDTSERDNLRARKVHTQFRVVTRIAAVVIWGLGIAAALMTFPSIRQLGTSILASAGVAGLVIGLAAQRTIGNFIAGLQIALTQPIRLDDAVVIDGEWGWIEEITATYVVVKIWDERRLIVPFHRLLEQPFQNWTRTTAHLLGQVSLWCDYRVPVQAVRDELHRVLGETTLWDGRVAVLQVIDASDRAVHLRALVSAADSPTAWDLRCFVRERLIGWLQREHPEALPTVRAAVARPPATQAVAELPPAGEPESGGLPGAPERADE